MSLAVLARKTKTLNSRKRLTNTSNTQKNTSFYNINQIVSNKNATQSKKNVCCKKEIVKTTSIKKQTSASDKINKKKMATIGYSNSNNNISTSSNYTESIKSKIDLISC